MTRYYYEIEITHSELNKYRHIRGTDRLVVGRKAAAQRALWDNQWERKKAALHKTESREKAAQDKAAKLKLAEEKTLEAEQDFEALGRILAHTLPIDDAVDWEVLTRTDDYPEPAPTKPTGEKEPPRPDQSNFKPKLNLFDLLIPVLKKKKTKLARSRLETAIQSWESTYAQNKADYESALKEHAADTKQWESEKANFEGIRESENNALSQLRTKYENGDPDAILDYCDIVLNNSQYPDYFPKKFSVDLNVDTGIFVVDYYLPHIDEFPAVKKIKYVQSRDEFDEIKHSNAEMDRTFDSVCYQIGLRTIHEIFEADRPEYLSAVVFNGWFDFLDPATGNPTRSCIMSVQANRTEFLSIDLAHVEPRNCFRGLKGVSSTKLHSIAPVAPLLQISREDSRFIDGIDVTQSMGDDTNIAAMGWEDFEHLVREVFEKEFAQNGGEVRITQASRDGGVDAIAFDPDPIRGGKIVLQAKRYTNTVDVSAVRDLYGTVMNEGAIKGILVTTSSFGPDAYKFANDKPLALIDGANLLHLLEKHGQKARIDIAEAKKELSSEPYGQFKR